MTGRGRRRRPLNPPRRGRRGSLPNEDRLRALGHPRGAQADPASEVPVKGIPKRQRNGTTGAVANEARLTALGEEINRSSRGRHGRRRSVPRSGRRLHLRRGILIGSAVLLIVIGGGAGYIYYLTHDLNRVDVRGLSGAFTTGQEAGTENILMMGSTSRCALAVQNAAYGLCHGSANSPPVNGVNSDVIMILHADPIHHRLALLSIPRDLFVPNARSSGANKVDAGLVQSPTQLVAAIEEDFGIPIQHAVTVDFDQFANIVDALDGINMKFPVSLFDWGGSPPPYGTGSSGLNVQAAACVHLNGIQALQVVRSRHLRYKTSSGSSDPYYWTQEALSDLARIRRDHEFLRVLATAVAKKGLGNPVTDINLINSVKGDLTFDRTWSVNDMANLVLDFHSVDINSVPQLTLPVAEVYDPNGLDGSYVYKGSGRTGYGDVEFPAQSQDQTAIDQVLGIGATTDSMTGEPLPSPSSVTVSVENGTGASNQAADTSTSLAGLGFHMVGVGDTPPVGDLAETTVNYGARTPAIEAAAEAVARSMSGSVVMAYDPSEVTDGAQVTVVTGTQFAVNVPTTTTGGGAGGTPTSTAPATTTSPGAAAIATPSLPTSNLQAWDPRACPAGATPTAPVPNRL
jgi:LCP family protein required for cell wall assembly